MPAFDRSSQKIVVRIVYDGAAHAGKTTNLRQLASHFTERRRSQIFVPSEIDGRTLYFDFMHLDGGLVAGQPLRCQFVTVPGQRTLAGRRKQILQSADAVVFVCSSAARSQNRNRVMLDTLRWSLRAVGRQDVPVIVQANKQDLRTALTPEAVREALGLAREVPVVGATAHTGGGVRETSVLAIRAAAQQVELLLLERGFDDVLGRAESSAELLTRLEQIHADHPTPEELQEELMETDEDGPAPTAARPLSEAPSAIEPAAAAGPALTASLATSALPSTLPPVSLAAPSAPPPEPPRPNENVPTGCVWPSTTGRQVLRTLASEVWRWRRDLSGKRGQEDGSGSPDALVYEVGTYCAKTSGRRRFDNGDEARAALLTLARRKIQLGDLLPPATVIAAQQDSEASWLWTLAPWLTTLRTVMNDAERSVDLPRLTGALRAFAAAAGRAVSLAAHQRLLLDVHPSNFAAVGSELYYLDDDIAQGDSLPQLGHALLQRVEEYAPHAAVIASYLTAVEQALTAAATSKQLEQLGVLDALEQAHTHSPQAQTAQRVLLQELRAVHRPVRTC